MAPRGNVASTEEKLDEMQSRYQVLEAEKRSNLEVSAAQIRNNKETIRKLTDDNNKLRADITKTSVSTRKLHDPTEEAIRLKAKLNAIASENARKEQLLSELKAQWKLIGGSVKQSAEQLEEKERKLRVVENRIDKAMIKLNEAQSIKKTYEGILSRLRDERVGFDQQLRDLENQLESKKKDLEELILLSHDATHAKEMAQAELHKFEQAVLEERNQRDREVMEKKMLVQQRLEMNQRMEKLAQEHAAAAANAAKAAAPATQEKSQPTVNQSKEAENELAQINKQIEEYEEAYSKIREITGVSDVNEIIQKYVTQRETNANLSRQAQEQQNKLDALEEEYKSVKAQLDDAKYSSSNANRRRSAIENMESLIFDSEQRLDRARARFDKLSGILVDINTGVSHLHAKLGDVKLDNHATTLTSSTAVTDDTLEDVLNVCEQKIAKLIATVGDAPDEEPTVVQNDVRSRPTDTVVEDTDFDNPQNELVLSRKQVKLNSKQFVDKIKKKQTTK